MKKHLFSFFLTLAFSFVTLFAQRGYYDAPYELYEADEAILSNGAVATPHSYAQSDLQSEASGQVCVDMSAESARGKIMIYR